MLALPLLQSLIATPSPSRQEEATAQLLYDFLTQQGARPFMWKHNVWALAEGADPNRPTLLLNSHHDTVPPAKGYTRDPYFAAIEGGRLYGLGSNDAGASVAALVETFLKMRSPKLPFNLLLALSAEEEVSGVDGLRGLLPVLAEKGFYPSLAIVGEPTGMKAAVAERGLVVLDCTAHGKAGHAARDEGDNALYHAVDDINRLRSLRFPRESAMLGPVHIAVTQIQAGDRHNMVPDQCHFTVDVRTTDAYTNQQTVDLIRQAITSEACPRSTRIHASSLSHSHPLFRACQQLGIETYVSPTSSDMSALPDVPSLKIGPGQSCRSHTADEFVLLSEIEEALTLYPRIIHQTANNYNYSLL